MSDGREILVRKPAIQLFSGSELKKRDYIGEENNLKRALEVFDSSLPSRRASEYSVESLVSLSSIKKTYENLEMNLESQKKRVKPHSVVMKEDAVTPVEIILKETPLKQWYTTGKTLGSLASIGAKVALQLLKNKKDEKTFKKLRLLEIEIVYRKLEE
ncbi:hypothetical protein [Mesotoga sp. BH458_6_3_2_1]|uniref:hypothetical protein n=1 Tax=Mesotoga sp. BH458_6_3_2_1 TaxID=1437446 RepID=UPI000EF1CB65|nr:hypothetical protein [Mesotoga sp. BH458_6_3_2_1]RLL81687.1 hypothetical protein Y697_13250 [Mesotoga sp. BH458_6_3_2_1]